MVLKINNPNRPVVLFIPEVGIYPFARGLAVLGDAIAKQNGKVLITHDTGQMLRSPIMAMNRIPVDASSKRKAFIYKSTDKFFRKVIQNYGFFPIELSDFVRPQVRKTIDDLVNNNWNDLERIKYRGFPVGKIAQYDFVLETKFPYSSRHSRLHKVLYAQYVKNTALTIAIVDGICERYKPSLLLAFNEYAQCQAARYSAKTHNVRYLALTYPVHFNIDGSRFSIWESTYPYWRYRHCQNWEKGKDIPIYKRDVIACWEDSILRMYGSGSHIFSLPKKNDPKIVFNNLKMDPRRKIIVVYTSSQDERISNEVTMKVWNEENNAHDVFKDQTEWLLWLRDYADKHSNIQIIVRIHPREGATRHGRESQHLHKLQDELKQNPRNFIVVWPENPISSYDLMELADVCLIAWSAMGQEAARLGIPVLTFTSNMLYPNDDFFQVATTLDSYKSKLDDILNMRTTFQHLIKAVRFYHWRTLVPSLDLGKTVPQDYSDDTVWPRAPQSKIKIINEILSGKEDLIEYNLKMWKKSLPKNAVIQERREMKRGIRYFLDNVFYPPPAIKKPSIIFIILQRIWREVTGRNFRAQRINKTFEDYHLKYTDDISQISSLTSKTKKDSKLRAIVSDGSEAILIHDGKLLHRMSPMVIRLAKLHEYN